MRRDLEIDVLFKDEVLGTYVTLAEIRDKADMPTIVLYY